LKIDSISDGRLIGAGFISK